VSGLIEQRGSVSALAKPNRYDNDMGSLIQHALNVPLFEEVTGLVPWQACQQLADLPHLVFFDSADSSDLGRYSYVSADPFAWLSARGNVVRENGHPVPFTDPFVLLGERLSRYRLAHVDELPPFQSGAAGLFGYELAHHIERLPRPKYDDCPTPDLGVGLYDWVLAFDSESGRAWLISSGFPDTEPRRRLTRAKRRLEQVQRWLDRPAAPHRWRPVSPRPVRTPQFPVENVPGVTSNFERPSYLALVQRAIEYIHAGDCFQVNLAQRLQAQARCSPLDMYGRLRECNPAPFAGYLDLGTAAIMSASPERFVRVHNGAVETRPIKGTRPRGRTAAEDRALANELCTSAKDRAENVMIVDLLRNDLGRVCRYGSVRVEAVCRLESYRYVHHLVSEVHGRLRPECTPVHLLRAAFPGGSVTGAPKIRAMEIITELEQTARGAYCGCLGYIGFTGAMDTNLLIRTFVHGNGWLQFSVGGGIVADSRPENEYEETWHKAEGLLQALGGDA
jgi:para-aminobenzoate synthetase component I